MSNITNLLDERIKQRRYGNLGQPASDQFQQSTQATGLQDYEPWCLGLEDKRADTLEMKKRTGESVTYPYPYTKMVYNASKGIHLTFGGEQIVIIRGHNIEKLHDDLRTYNVTRIIECPELYRSGKDEPCVEKIEWPEDEDW